MLHSQGLVPFESIDVESLLKEHKQIARQLPKYKVNVDRYYLLHADISLQVSHWISNSVSGALLNNTSRNNGVVLHQTVHFGEPSSPAIEFWMQLHMLDLIKQQVLRFKESKDPNDLVYNIGMER